MSDYTTNIQTIGTREDKGNAKETRRRTSNYNQWFFKNSN